MSLLNRTIFYKEQKQFNSKRKVVINIQERYLTNEVIFLGNSRNNDDIDVKIYLITLETMNFIEILVDLIKYNSDTKNIFVITETTLKYALQLKIITSKYQKILYDLIQDKNCNTLRIMMNENSQDIFTVKSVDEKWTEHHHRNFFSSLQWLLSSYSSILLKDKSKNFFVLTYSVEDSLVATCRNNNLTTRTLPEMFFMLLAEDKYNFTDTDEVESLREDIRNTISVYNTMLDSGLQKNKSTSNGIMIMNQTPYAPHLSTSDVKKGLLAGKLSKGTFKAVKMAKGRVSQGVVKLSKPLSDSYFRRKSIFLDDDDGDESSNHEIEDYGNVDPSNIVVLGESANRALHLDEVVVRINPQREWQDLSLSHTTAIEDDRENKHNEEEVAPPYIKSKSRLRSLQPTGCVVAILRRNKVVLEGFIVCTPQSSSTSLSSSVVCHPIDKKLPSVMVRGSHRSLAQLMKNDKIDQDNNMVHGQHRLQVRLHNGIWDRNSRLPLVDIIKVISVPKAMTRGSHITDSTNKTNDLRPLLELEVSTLLTNNSLERHSSSFPPRAISHLRQYLGLSKEDQRSCLWSPSPIWLENEGQRSMQQGCKREDMTDDFVFSIDPPGCMDIDDAMCVRPLINSHNEIELEVSVHIADVNAFLSNDSVLDEEARIRATTLYLPHRRLDMLPTALSADACSLHPKVDRLSVCLTWRFRPISNNNQAFKLGINSPETKTQIEIENLCWKALKNSLDESVRSPSLSCHNLPLRLLAVDKNGHLKEWTKGMHHPEPINMHRCIVHSRVALSYNQADRILQGIDPGVEATQGSVMGAGVKVPSIIASRVLNPLQVLTILSRQCYKMREEGGAWDLNAASTEEQRFGLDASGILYSANSSSSLGGGNDVDENEGNLHCEVHETVMEMMVMANCAVARVLAYHLKSSALLRCHTQPSLRKLINVRDKMKELGIEVRLPEDLDADLDSKVDIRDGAVAPSSQSVVEFAEQLRLQMRNLLNQINMKTSSNSSGSNSKNNSSGSDNDKHDGLLRLISSLVLETMEEATIRPLGSDVIGSPHTRHVGLGVECYTHFTSPIRRYVDVIVHRQLLSVLSKEHIGSSSTEMTVDSMLLSESQVKHTTIGLIDTCKNYDVDVNVIVNKNANDALALDVDSDNGDLMEEFVGRWKQRGSTDTGTKGNSDDIQITDDVNDDMDMDIGVSAIDDYNKYNNDNFNDNNNDSNHNDKSNHHHHHHHHNNNHNNNNNNNETSHNNNNVANTEDSDDNDDEDDNLLRELLCDADGDKGHLDGTNLNNADCNSDGADDIYDNHDDDDDDLLKELLLGAKSYEVKSAIDNLLDHNNDDNDDDCIDDNKKPNADTVIKSSTLSVSTTIESTTATAMSNIWSPADMLVLADHLTDINRRTKLLQRQCSRVFLAYSLLPPAMAVKRKAVILEINRSEASSSNIKDEESHIQQGQIKSLICWISGWDVKIHVFYDPNDRNILVERLQNVELLVSAVPDPYGRSPSLVCSLITKSQSQSKSQLKSPRNEMADKFQVGLISKSTAKQTNDKVKSESKKAIEIELDTTVVDLNQENEEKTKKKQSAESTSMGKWLQNWITLKTRSTTTTIATASTTYTSTTTTSISSNSNTNTNINLSMKKMEKFRRPFVSVRTTGRLAFYRSDDSKEEVEKPGWSVGVKEDEEESQGGGEGKRKGNRNHHSNYSQTAAINRDVAACTGVNAAKAKYEQWHEVWPEEEELPSTNINTTIGNTASKSTCDTGKGLNDLDIKNSNILQEIKRASSRTYKLKASKRNMLSDH